MSKIKALLMLFRAKEWFLLTDTSLNAKCKDNDHHSIIRKLTKKVKEDMLINQTAKEVE
jgi:hypothetical protein